MPPKMVHNPVPLEYHTPAPKPPPILRLAPLIVAAFTFLAIVALLRMIPTTTIWYFGAHTSHVIAVESGELVYGTAEHPRSFGPAPVVAAVAVITTIPAWIINRLLMRLLVRT